MDRSGTRLLTFLGLAETVLDVKDGGGVDGGLVIVGVDGRADTFLTAYGFLTTGGTAGEGDLALFLLIFLVLLSLSLETGRCSAVDALVVGGNVAEVLRTAAA